MLFNSFTFLGAFLPIGLALWWTIRSRTARLWILAGANTIFYAWFDPRFVPVLGAIAVAGFLGGVAIAGSRSQSRRRMAIALTVAAHLAVLIVFKYLDFLSESVEDLAGAIGLGWETPGFSIVFPVGVGFYVLNSLSYVIDVYRGRAEVDRSPLEYYAFVGLFPHLLAGPILRYAEIGPQLRSLPATLEPAMMRGGLTLLGIGLAKKLLIADQLAPTVDQVFSGSGDPALVTAWAAAVGYTLQLYFDFSGYSDMAIGVAAMFGFRFPQNFDSPLKAQNISDFWRRWHMTLSRWMRDYVYIPLGGSRGSQSRTARNLGATMFVAGLWHGAAWTYVLWGLYHGVLLALHHLARGRKVLVPSAEAARGATFLAVVVGFVVFRAPDVGVAGDVYAGMAGLNGVGAPLDALRALGGPFLLTAALALLITQTTPNSWQVVARPVRLSYAVPVGLLAGVALITLAEPSPFLYFQF